MKITSEQELIKLGQEFGAKLRGGEVVELVGDVGAGKTTFVKGLAAGLGVVGDVTSPSFMIMKEYCGDKLWLKHYDFYRLNDAGIMRAELVDSLRDPQTVTVVEWAESAAGVLPANRQVIEIKYLPDADGREVKL